ncbi:peroxisomal adenine nucleotide transporter 1 [Trichomonascus vanleenenianus]|uniref:peroxisomal adenine nucleotide transporter 1 n=1 Tax=Trichomonascus vanleenenianus TaxID=2268995 RepID=UPI003EC9C902
MSDKKKIVRPSDIPPLATAFSGAIGGAVANLSLYPLAVVITRLQVQKKTKSAEKKYDGIVDTFIKVYEEGGIKEFYSGAAGDTIATMSSAFFYFFAYEDIRTRRVKYLKTRSASGRAPATLGVAEELAIGTVAGMFCKFITSPLNNIVTRQQAQGAKKPVREVIADIWRDKGITGFWTGYRAVVLLSLNPSLTYYFFQYLKAVLIPRRRRDNPTSTELFFLSACAKIIATLMTYPWMLSKTRMQAQAKSERREPVKFVVGEPEQSQVEKLKSALTFKVITDVTDVYKSEGLAGVYQGAKGQVLRGFFTQGITMATKDQISKLIIWFYFVFFRPLTS